MVDINRKYNIQHSKHYNDFSTAWLRDESDVIREIADRIHLTRTEKDNIDSRAIELVTTVRKERLNKSGLDAFMVQYDLSSEEGIVLMCLAEALLRVPDSITADRLIKDKLTSANWKEHLGTSDSMFVNAATWSLMLTGKILSPTKRKSKHLSNIMKSFLDKRSRPIVRKAALQAMKILGQQYVMGETIEKAIKRAKGPEKKGYTYSYDMLGEAATTMADAEYYYKAYHDSINAIGKSAKNKEVKNNAGISVKLSALHPRYEIAQSQRVHQEMYPKLLKLMELAKSYNIGLNIDAEETERLEISLEIIERLAHEPSLSAWDGMGIVVQAYQKRGYHVLQFLIDLARRSKRRFMVRLVKGAYWDSEIKHSQEQGAAAYMVFTQKCHTDMSYLACAKLIFENADAIYPQFATHNALTVSTIMEFAKEYKDYEFQCLHGMGDALYDHVVGKGEFGGIPCRIYAPVGTYKHLLPYLVRRLLENGANSSFVNRIVDEQVPIEQLIENPTEKAQRLGMKQHPSIPLPKNLFGARMNSKGININDFKTIDDLSAATKKALKLPMEAYPLIDSKEDCKGEIYTVKNPSDQNEIVGKVHFASEKSVDIAMTKANNAFDAWDATPADDRATMLEKTADLLEENFAEFIGIAVKEAGKTLGNAVDEVREAVDFCRYYAMQARKDFSKPTTLPSPTGELDQISLHGRGVVVCISPWNFPLAIFLGQVVASLVAGNTVVAKPAEQTSLIAFRAVELLYQAGVPKDVIQLLPGNGETVGSALINDSRVAGVIFTGSTGVARLIQKTLANKPGAITPLIAETGGQNCMVVDSSALPEQVVRDVIKSSFDSAGQRCSALRVLFLQEDTADIIITMLKGAMKELSVGNPNDLENDIGPVIDKEAQANLLGHIEDMKQNAKLVYQVEMHENCKNGTFVPPTAVEIPDLQSLTQEFFGPILHIVRYKAKDLHKLPTMINGTGFGLTFGLHSRIEETVEFFKRNIKAGNIYVNRNIVGAVVGVQPFGGRGLSGTGPKAGGPQYLHKLATEKTVSIDTTASGGNASLMTLDES